MLAMLSAFPVLLLVMRGSMSALLFAMSALSMVALVRSGAWRGGRCWNADMIAFALAMASAMAVILPAQIYHHDLHWRPYDEAARLLLAVPVCLAVRACTTPVVPVLGIAMPVGAMLAMAVIGNDSGSMVAGRMGASFLNVIHSGNLALMLGMLSLFSIRAGVERAPILITLKLCGLLAGLYLSLRSGTRGGWLVIPVLLILWAMLELRLRSLMHAAMALGVMLVLAIAIYALFDLIQLRATDLQSDLEAFGRGQKDTSTGLRLQILQVVAHVLRENPLFGPGMQGYRAALETMAQTGAITSEAVLLGNAEVHNQILSYGVKYGLPGLVSGLAIHLVPWVLFARALKSATGEARAAAQMGLCLVTGFFVFGLTVEILNLKHTVAFYSMTLAVLLGAATRRVARGAMEATAR